MDYAPSLLDRTWWVTDILGRTFQPLTIEANSISYELNTTHFYNGTYILKDETNKTYKFVVEK